MKDMCREDCSRSVGFVLTIADTEIEFLRLSFNAWICHHRRRFVPPQRMEVRNVSVLASGAGFGTCACPVFRSIESIHFDTMAPRHGTAD